MQYLCFYSNLHYLKTMLKIPLNENDTTKIFIILSSYRIILSPQIKLFEGQSSIHEAKISSKFWHFYGQETPSP